MNVTVKAVQGLATWVSELEGVARRLEVSYWVGEYQEIQGRLRAALAL